MNKYLEEFRIDFDFDKKKLGGPFYYNNPDSPKVEITFSDSSPIIIDFFEFLNDLKEAYEVAIGEEPDLKRKIILIGKAEYTAKFIFLLYPQIHHLEEKINRSYFDFFSLYEKIYERLEKHGGNEEDNPKKPKKEIIKLEKLFISREIPKNGLQLLIDTKFIDSDNKISNDKKEALFRWFKVLEDIGLAEKNFNQIDIIKSLNSHFNTSIDSPNITKNSKKSNRFKKTIIQKLIECHKDFNLTPEHLTKLKNELVL